MARGSPLPGLAGWATAQLSRPPPVHGSRGHVRGAWAATALAIVAPTAPKLVSLVSSNLLGFNAWAIAATEAAYERMGPGIGRGMVGHHAGASAAVSALMPFTQQLKKLAPIGAADRGSRCRPPFGAAGFTRLINVGANNVGNGNVGVQRRLRAIWAATTSALQTWAATTWVWPTWAPQHRLCGTPAATTALGNTAATMASGLLATDRSGLAASTPAATTSACLTPAAGNGSVSPTRAPGNFDIGNSGTGNWPGNNGQHHRLVQHRRRQHWRFNPQPYHRELNTGNHNTGSFNAVVNSQHRLLHRRLQHWKVANTGNVNTGAFIVGATTATASCKDYYIRSAPISPSRFLAI